MHIEEFMERFPTEECCRMYLEQAIWRHGRVCPHCGNSESWAIAGVAARTGLYECSGCHRQFTITTKTPMHSTKLPLRKWLLAIYYMLNSSKGYSSVFLANNIGVRQKTAWRMAHAIREMMDMRHERGPAVGGVVELDEKFVGGKPRKQEGVVHKRGKGTSKQGVLVMVERSSAERSGVVRTGLIANDSQDEIAPLVERHVDKDSFLMTDQNPVYGRIAKGYAGHAAVNHGNREFVRGAVHNNTAESFNAIVERAKFGVYHRLSKKHLQRYLNEIAFRWNHRQPVKRQQGRVVMEPAPLLDQIWSLLSHCLWRQIRRTSNYGFRVCSVYV
jgi:transposase-like protein